MGDRRSGILGDSESPWALTKRGEDRGPGGGEGESVRRAVNSASYFLLNFFILCRPCDVLVHDPSQLQLLHQSFSHLRHFC